jgi:hypothetical protein
MRTNKSIITATLVAAALLIGVGYYQTALADGTASSPGSTNDPIVTKSYVDQKLAEVTSNGGLNASNATPKLEVVTIPLGKKIIMSDGGQLVVRVGKAIAYSTDTNGLSDLTDGLDISPGKPVPTNHLILFPRGGRGVQADPSQTNGLTVLAIGTYKIE